MLQDQLKQRVECLTVDIKNLEDTNKSLHEQLTFMQTVIDNEQAEHDKVSFVSLPVFNEVVVSLNNNWFQKPLNEFIPTLCFS